MLVLINHMTTVQPILLFLKFMFSKKATKIDKIFLFDTYFVNIKSMVKISWIFVAFSDNLNFNEAYVSPPVLLCSIQ